MFFTLAQNASDEAQRLSSHTQALKICQFVQRKVVTMDGRLILPVPSNEFHRLQKAYFTSATLHSLIRPAGSPSAIIDYFTSIELVLRPPPPYSDSQCYTMRELILATYIAGYVVCARAGAPIPREIVESLTIPGEPPFLVRMSDPGFNLFDAVHTAGERLLTALLHVGGGTLPVLLLLPDLVARLSTVLFAHTSGTPPAICVRHKEGAIQLPSESIKQQTNAMTSTILLTLAKRFQDSTALAGEEGIPGLGRSIQPNTAFIIILYYVSLALEPSPSTYNNLGILLSGVSTTTVIVDADGRQQVLNGHVMANLYYRAGLQLDRTHPHLLTNLASLLKDLGQIDQAIQLYMEAIRYKPDFDIALANLGNAIKDAVRLRLPGWD